VSGTYVTYGDIHQKSIGARRCEQFFGILKLGQAVRRVFRDHD